MGLLISSRLLFKMAEMVGFEPTNGFLRYTLSKRAPSTTRTHLQRLLNRLRGSFFITGAACQTTLKSDRMIFAPEKTATGLSSIRNGGRPP